MKKDNSYIQGYILLDKVPFNSEENKILDTIVFHTIDLIFKLESEGSDE